MNPQYIKLTAVRVTMPPATDQRGRPIGQAEVKILQPPVVQLIPLPVAFNKGQVDGRAERNDSGVAVTYRELFDDVLIAIGEAEKLGRAIALPIDRQMIDAAAASARPKAPIIPLTVQEAVETAVNGVKAALDAEEAPKKFSSVADLIADLNEDDQVDENAPQWKDFVQTDGENLGGPTVTCSAPAYSREPRAGDLRIHSVRKGQYFLEQAFDGELHGEPAITWAAPSLPFNLLRSFDSRDELIETVHASGRGNLLVNE
jgi:hypothetical protein